ncbi:DNA translocase FtsK [Campylobacter sputorum subsp. bubulus]|uniref:DNA translocase FtsK n=1 Tax=Campylobacter sputorum subsp. sputorum TaxID=32024 RepID=A0A381DGL7_9BACT|nr:DNA segregation ATPase FtsK/SpoIIIE [Campylobacter sputorum aubsp. sputorum RM3237]QEL05108.1 DNA segregation ATPase FtsK/SpoIIIE [Campylobacter sputorum subsp. sputorum]SUX09402.1 DNA translocase FtsK [Campylobacter sputorum subsp. sputorum]SUX30827.1 DNA translocase FtsK [Campylobacter sputorum subsp. bubulus]
MIILRESVLTFVVCFLIFFGVATILPDSSFVGIFGNIIGKYNYKLFGLICYIYPFLLIVLAIYFRKNFKGFNLRFFELIIGILLLFFSFLLFQGNFIKDPYKVGVIGYYSMLGLRDFVGTIGGVVFNIMIFIISLVLIFEENIVVIFKNAFIEPVKGLKQDNKTKLKQPHIKQNNNKECEIVNEVKSDDEFVCVDDTSEILDESSLKEEEQTEKDLSQKEEKKTSKTIKNVELVNEVAENKKLLDELEKGNVEKPNDFSLPPLSFLKDPPKKTQSINEAEIDSKISDLLDKLKRFKIDGDVVRTYSGPVVTTFEFKPAAHIKVSKILTLQDDLAMALKAKTIRIQAPIPGKDVVGIEIPNDNIQTIYLKEILQSDIFKDASSPLTIALGKDIVGDPFVTDLKKLPHLLIAGTTGSGKSVGINAMLLSLLYRNSPKTLRLIMIDPKMLEFSIYNDIPHLLTPVITQAKQAITALSNLVNEMERRYKIMSHTRTKNIENYNDKIKKTGGEIFPYIVVIIDELADLMMTSGKDVEFYIGRLAQMARASGIHLIVATQRPSVDVVTGLIKANLPSRISYRVGQKIDSKVILDQMGAESLLGRGDMLFTPPSSTGLIRLHAPFASEEEIEKVVEFLKEQQEVVYDDKFLKDSDDDSSGLSGGSGVVDGELDELYEEAKNIVLSEEKTSISYIQRRLRIGYNRAATIIEQLENMGVLTAPNSKGQRDIIK